VAAGYTFYRDDRQRYLRIGVLIEDLNYQTKNDRGGIAEKDPIALQWLLRLALANDWFLFSEGALGSGFERVLPAANAPPDVSRHKRRANSSHLQVSRIALGGSACSATLDWQDFVEDKQFTQPGLDYDYENTQLTIGAEHLRVLRVLHDRHQLRVLIDYVDRKARSRGFNEHDYERTDVVGGAFYEYLRANSGVTFAYALGLSDIS
jgi:hypothetical protein